MADDALTRKDAEMERLTRLVNVHRGWCNYCKGNVEWCDRCPEGGCALRDYLRSLESVREEARRIDALAEFTEYFVANYPGPSTIIHDPKWHAPKIFRAAERALQRAPARVAEGESVREALINLVSLLLQTMKPIGPMRDRKDYPPELQTAINVLRAAPESLAKDHPGEQKLVA